MVVLLIGVAIALLGLFAIVSLGFSVMH